MSLPETMFTVPHKDAGDDDEGHDAWLKAVANFEYLLQRLDTISDLISAQIEGRLDASAAAVQAFFDGLPTLPYDPAGYPERGGLFRVGDANGYHLVRIYPKS